MSHLKGLSELEAVVNGPLVGEWPTRIGSLMLNFASIELISYQYLNVLEKSRRLLNRNFGKTLSNRIDRIIKLIPDSAAIDEAHYEHIIDLWKSVREMKDWRNKIAHNPVVYYWSENSNSETDPPDRIGIPNTRQLKNGDIIKDVISLEGMIILIDESARIGKELNDAIYRGESPSASTDHEPENPD